jgi:hypothetical protein
MMHHIPSLKDAVYINHAHVIRSVSSIAVPLNSKAEVVIYYKTFQMEYPFAISNQCHVHFFYLFTNVRMPPQCAHAVNAVTHSLILQSAFINSCDDVNNEIQAQALGMKLTPHENLDIQLLSSFEVAAVEFKRREGKRGGEEVQGGSDDVGGTRTKWGR